MLVLKDRRLHAAVSAARYTLRLGSSTGGTGKPETRQLGGLELHRRYLGILHGHGLLACMYVSVITRDGPTDRQGSWVVSKLGPRIAGLISVFTAATSLIISSFLTRHVAGLIIFHGVVFGSSSGLGYMVSPGP